MNCVRNFCESLAAASAKRLLCDSLTVNSLKCFGSYSSSTTCVLFLKKQKVTGFVSNVTQRNPLCYKRYLSGSKENSEHQLQSSDGGRDLSYTVSSKSNSSSLSFLSIDSDPQNILEPECDLAPSRDPFAPADPEEIADVSPGYQPSFNFAPYVNRSETLQQLVKLGVKLYRWERKPNVMEFVLKMDFERDMVPRIQFLLDVGLPTDQLGWYLTKSPYILQQDMDDLQVRLKYLETKQFSSEAITRIVCKNPYWLIFSVTEIDERLGFFQSTFKLSGEEVRHIATTQPRLITTSYGAIKTITFNIEEEMGFTKEERKKLLLIAPIIWRSNGPKLSERFFYLHNIMGIPHEQLLTFPGVLRTRISVIKPRHLYLQSLGRAQYDPTVERYVSLKALVTGTDVEFCENVAKTTLAQFLDFQKIL